MKKRRTPLQNLLESVKVVSLANGDLYVTPVYRGVQPYTEQDGGGPGLLTRRAAAHRLENVINRHLKQK